MTETFQIPQSPVSALGTLSLLVAFIVIAYAAAAGVVGQRLGRPRLVQSSLYAAYAFCALLTFASALIVYAFVAHDYTIKYVQHYSDSTMPLFYKLTAYWGGLDGSLLFWVWMLSMFATVALFVNRHRHRDMIGYVVATIAAVSIFFMALLLYSKNPFSTFLTQTPTEGRGLNPLLQTYWMAIHPPSLYVGYVGMTIPFAFGVGALASGRLDDAWLQSVRVWVLIPWFFLSFGLILGGLWAYEELGWGGYWAWDPVENAGLLPWFTATAFLHSTMIQERRGMMKVWNMTLIIVNFFLTIFGTFMTRSGIVQSVHAFGQDNELALLFLIFLAVMLIVTLGLLIYRLPALRSVGRFESFFSREVVFLLNNWILLACAFFVLFLTMFPTLSEYIMKQRITVGPPTFNLYMVPLGLILLFLTGVGPLLAWRHTSGKRLLEQFAFPVAVGILTCGILAFAWPPSLAMVPFFADWLKLPLVLFNFGLIAFVIATVAQEFFRGMRVRMRETGSDPITALIGVVVSKRRKYGGYIVHIGIAVMFFGFAGKFYGLEKPATLEKPGQSFELGGYTFRYDDLTITPTPQKDMITAKVAVLRGKETVATLYPARWAYKAGNQEVTSEVAIDRRMGHDIYVVLNGIQGRKTANFTVYLNPLINFVWLGFGFLALGTAICLLPESLAGSLRPRRRTLVVGKGAAVLLVLAGITLGLVRLANAQTAPEESATTTQSAPSGTQGSMHVEQEGGHELGHVHPIVAKLWHDLVCMCGGCPRERLSDCRCGFAANERQKIAERVADMNLDLAKKEDQQRAYDAIVAMQVAKYGGKHVLAVPEDTAFNRLAWIVPYAAMGGGVVLIFLVARSFVRRGRTQAAVAQAGPQGAKTEHERDLEDRLDDELRDLD